MKTAKTISSKCWFVGAVVVGLASGQMAYANLTIINDLVGGGALSDATYANLDGLIPGSGGGVVSPTLTVTVTPNAKVVLGSSSGEYAAPFLTGNNNQYFGGNYVGQDNTTYLTAGSYGATAGAAVTLDFNSGQNYLGLLWGSVDAYNTLSFYNNGTLVGSLTGADVINNPNGSQGPDGTTYVNILSDQAFNQVVATSSQFAFEFDNVAYGPVPEPSTVFAGAMLLLPMSVSAVRILRKKSTI